MSPLQKGLNGSTSRAGLWWSEQEGLNAHCPSTGGAPRSTVVRSGNLTVTARRGGHSLSLSILLGQDLCLWHHRGSLQLSPISSWKDQDSLVVRSSHSIPILEATIYPATACVNHFLEKTDRTENGERHSLNPKNPPFSFVPWSPAIILLLCFGSLLKRTKDKDKRGAAFQMGIIFRYYLKFLVMGVIFPLHLVSFWTWNR